MIQVKSAKEIEIMKKANQIAAEALIVAGNMTVSSSADGGKAAVVWVKGADFGSGASSSAVKAKGKGRIEVYLDGKDTLVGAAEISISRR